MPIEFALPDLGENIENGDVVSVLVAVGAAAIGGKALYCHFYSMSFHLYFVCMHCIFIMLWMVHVLRNKFTFFQFNKQR